MHRSGRIAKSDPWKDVPPPDLGRPAAMGDIGRVARLASQGATPHALRQATRDIIDRWRLEPIGTRDLRERLETLQSDVDAGMVAADDYAAEAEDHDQRRQAEMQRAALMAIRRVVQEELEGMRVLI